MPAVISAGTDYLGRQVAFIHPSIYAYRVLYWVELFW